MYSGSYDGTIRVWNRTTLEHERTLVVSSEGIIEIWSFDVWEGFLINGDIRGVMVVWNVAAGDREWELEGHVWCVNPLAVEGSLLLSGSDDRSVKVSLRCGRWELAGHGRAQGRWRVMRAESRRWRRGRARW